MNDSAREQLGIDPELLQEELTTLEGVRAVRVVGNPRGRIREIHIVADPGRTPKQIVRDVQTLCAAKFGTEIDYRIVSIVQIGAEGIARIGVQPQTPTLESISWSLQSTQAQCRVVLVQDENHGMGEAAGVATKFSRANLAAKATIEAFRDLTKNEDGELLESSLIDLAGHRVAVVAVSTGSQIATASALADLDDGQAIAKAILVALASR